MPRSLCAALAACAVLAAWAGEAAASGFALRDNSAVAIGTAFAGRASSAEDLSTIFNNPAGMTYLPGGTAQIGGAAIFSRARFSGSGTSRTLGGAVPTSAVGSSNGGEAGFVPSAYALADVAPDLKFGLAVTAPFGLSTKYDDGWVGRYLGVKSNIVTVDVNPNLAYRVNDWLSVGGGVSAQYIYAELTQAINTSALVGAPPNTAFPDGRTRVSGDDWGWGYNLGVIVEPLTGTRLGAAFRSRVRHTVTGNVEFTMPAPFSSLPQFQNSPATTPATLPANATVGLTQAITPKLTVMSDVQWTQWSSFSVLTVQRSNGVIVSSTPENFRDTVFVSLGATYKYNERWTSRIGAAFDQTPVKDQFRTVRLPDQDRILVGLGFGYRMSDSFAVDGAYLHVFNTSDPTITGSVNAVSPTGDVLAGRFSGSADVVSLQVRFRF